MVRSPAAPPAIYTMRGARSRVAIAARRYVYWFMRRVMYAPEIPGRIMAHRAMNPVMKSTGREWPSAAWSIPPIP